MTSYYDGLKQACQAAAPYGIAVRRELHMHPELSALEFRTVRYLKAQLEQLGIPCVDIPDGGIVGTLEGSEPGRSVLLRADCDALPIEEAPNNAKQPKVCVSQVPGVSHMCGHDLNSAMLMTAAKVLSERRDQIQGRILFLFERGEEGANNIYHVMKYFEQEKTQIDCVLALHGDADLPVGTYSVMPGGMVAGSIGFGVEVKGEGGHGSRPDLCNNPVDCFVAICGYLQNVRMKYTDPLKPFTSTVGVVHAGTRGNVIPDKLMFEGTARYFDREQGVLFDEKLREGIAQIGALYGCECRIPFHLGPSFPVYNHPVVTDLCRRATEWVWGENVLRETERSLGCESFSTLTAYYPGAMGYIGVRNEEKGMTIGVHNAAFEPDEDCIPLGAAIYAAFALEFLSSGVKLSYSPYHKNIEALTQETGMPVPPHQVEPA